MPTVPTYDNLTVQQQNLPNARQDAPYRMMQMADIGPGEQMREGAAMQKAGGELAKIALDQQANVNEGATKSGDATMLTGINAILHGSDDGTTPGYLNTKGGDALSARDAAVKAVQDLVVKTTDGLDNDRQREMFKNLAQVRAASAIAQINAHNAQQTQVYHTAAATTRAKAAADSAAGAFNPLSDNPLPASDPSAPEANTPYQQAIRTVQSEANDLADLNGIADPAYRAQFVKEQMQKAYLGTLSHLIDGKQTQVAKSYFDSVKDQLDTATRDKVQTVLQQGAVQDKVLSYSDHLFDSVKGENAQLAQVRKDFEAGALSGQERELVEARVNRMAAQRRQAEDQYTASAVGQAQDFLIKNPGASVTDLPPQIYRALESKGHLAALDSFAQREGNKTNPAAWFNVQTHFGDGSDMDIGKMSDTDWMMMRGAMSDHDWKDWSKQRDALKSGEVAPSKDPGNLHTQGFNAALNNRMISLGINPAAAKSTDDKERIGAIQQFASQWVIADQQAAGKRFNQEETQKSLDRLFATNVQFRTSYLGGMFHGGTTAQRMVGMTANDIPPAAKEGIKNDLIRGGNPNPSDRDILMQYWSLHGHTKGAPVTSNTRAAPISHSPNEKFLSSVSEAQAAAVASALVGTPVPWLFTLLDAADRVQRQNE